MNFQFSLLQLHTKSLCVLALQNSQFEASTSSRPQTVNFEALGHKAILKPCTARFRLVTNVAFQCCISFLFSVSAETGGWDGRRRREGREGREAKEAEEGTERAERYANASVELCTE